MSQVVAAIIRNIHDGGQINGELTPTYRSFGRGDIFAFNWPGTGSEIYRGTSFTALLLL